MKIVIGDIEEGPLKEAEDELTSRGAEVVGVAHRRVRSRVGAKPARPGPRSLRAVHLVHNNAGVGLGGPIWEVSEEDWRWILGVNLLGRGPRHRHLRAAAASSRARATW